MFDEAYEYLGIATDDGFVQLNAYRAVELDSLVSKRDGSLVRLESEQMNCDYSFPGGGFAGAEQLEPVFHFIIETDVFSPRDLPGVPSNEIKTKITSDLIREGLLKIVGKRTSPVE